MELLFSRIYILLWIFSVSVLLTARYVVRQLESCALSIYVYFSRFSYFVCLNCFFLIKEIAYRKY